MPPKHEPPGPRAQMRAQRAEDFEAIREAVMETARGRWFLDEFATRLRAAETAQISDGLSRLEKAVSANHDALMSRLAEALRNETVAARAQVAPQADLSPRHMKYFRADEDVFEPAPHAQIAAVPSLPRLQEIAAEAVSQEEPPRKRRIVIIRHKPGEQIDVPLADDLAKAS